MGKGALAERIDAMIREVTGEWEAPAEGASSDRVSDDLREPTKVVVQPESPPWIARLPVVLSPVLELLTTLALAAVLAVFMLLKREDLRNRFIRLVGVGRITGTTKAVDDACERVSRYLLMQLVINGTYGLAWGLGLWLIGVEYAVLWGFLAVVLRYVPYVGAPIAALLPMALSLVQFPGWWEPLAVVGLLLVLELISNNIMEPWLYGMSMGVSEVAGLVAAAFWGFLWGPIGLVLSSPLTVVLVVLGKYVPQLEFFDVLLGDQPVLKPEVAYYQRLLARDQDEAFDMVLTQLRQIPVEEIYDKLLLPPLSFVKRDRMRDELTEEDETFVCQATREVLEDLASRPVIL
jgi:predicted PurR-regulated permease PerM